MSTVIRTVLAAIFKGTCSLVLGGTILGIVARNCDRRDGVAYVHVSTPGVDVSVDDIVYHVESLRETPIVCGLPPGRHLLRMSRGDAVLYEEVFSLQASEDVVLCAWEQPCGSSRRRRSLASFRGGTAAEGDLTASARRPRP